MLIHLKFVFRSTTKIFILAFIAWYFQNRLSAGLHGSMVWAYVSEYLYTPDDSLKVKKFPEMSEEWLDFIVSCRLGHSHAYDIVEGPMANDTIFNYVQNFVDGKISREAFWELAKFKRPTHQISFHTARALATLTFVKGSEVRDEE